MWTRLLLLTLLLFFPACSSNADKAGAPAKDAAVPPEGASAPAGESAAPAPAAGRTTAETSRTAPAEAWAAIRSGALLVDVRTPAEYEQGHLEGALLIPHDQVAARASELGEDKERAIVLYCRTGNRSSQAKKALEGLGFTNVMNAGGYEGLKQAH